MANIPAALGRLALPARQARAHSSPRPGSPAAKRYLEAFAQIYRDFADQILAAPAEQALDAMPAPVPGIEDGLRGMRFIAAAVASSQLGATWVPVG
ncbi:hypothetical protein [Falsiroseomonas sp. E2-1-a4]|uniref:hypothetical protein n=1 Tax=Falsiroseomonas sp. E2-1-a4 TaxID=3239299 RepID=UPI003F36DE02